MINDNLLIHIGYHKTGTTWLQNELFRSENNVFEPLSLQAKGRSTLSWDFLIGQDGYLLSSFESNKEVIKASLLKILKQKGGCCSKVFVLTSERFSGHPHAGGFEAKILANRLNDIFPKAKILIVIREQRSFIKSLYFQYLSKVGAGVLSLKRYLCLPYDTIPYFSPNNLNFNLLVEYYFELFGRENVLVLPYELFKLDPIEYVGKIGIFINREIEIDESRFQVLHNTNRRTFVLYYFRYLNFFIRRKSLNFYSIYSNKYSRYLAIKIQSTLMLLTPKLFDKWLNFRTQKYIQDWVGNRYELSNSKLSDLINIDLSKYGYHTPMKSKL